MPKESRTAVKNPANNVGNRSAKRISSFLQRSVTEETMTHRCSEQPSFHNPVKRQKQLLCLKSVTEYATRSTTTIPYLEYELPIFVFAWPASVAQIPLSQSKS